MDNVFLIHGQCLFDPTVNVLLILVSRKRSSGTAGPRFSIPTRACPRESGG
jgi:hypothetical protein